MRSFVKCLTFISPLVALVSLPIGSHASPFPTTGGFNTTSATSSAAALTTVSSESSETTTTWVPTSNTSLTSTTALTVTTSSVDLSQTSTSSDSVTVLQTSSSITSTASQSATSTWSLKENSTTEASTATYSSTTISAAAASATVTLAPAVHWDHDLSNLDHVSPQPSAKFYYSEQPGISDPSKGGQFAHVSTNFTYPSVVLEHSGLINAVTCTPSGGDSNSVDLQISFSTFEAYQAAKGNWTLHADLVLVTYIPNCGVAGNDQRAFWKTSDLKFDDAAFKISATGTEIPFHDSVKEMDLEWGNYEPPPPENPYITVDDDNSTFTGNYTTSTCGKPSSTVVGGLPAASCGFSFDQRLDDAIGYTKGTGSKSKERRSIMGRCAWYDAPCWAKKAWDAAAALVSKYDPHWDPSVSKAVSFNLGPSFWSSSITKFGYAYKLFTYQRDSSNYVTAYCVNCGVSGKVTLWGKASIALLEGVRSAQVGMYGNLHAGLYFGIDAHGSLSTSYNQALWSVGIPGLSVPGIYSIGPMVSVGAQMSIGIQASGQVLVGAAMDWPAFSVTMDLVHGSNSGSSGLSPTLSTTFLAGGQISASAGIGFPISVGIGLDIPAINFHKALELVEKPGLSASVTYNGGTSPITGLTSSCSNGISSYVTFTNDVYVSVFDITNYNIYHYSSSPFLRSCYKLRPREDEEEPYPKEAREITAGRSTRREVVNNSSSLAPAGSTYSSIVDVDLVYQLFAGADGNLYLDHNGDPSGTLFNLKDNITLADSIGRTFHYYTDAMSKYGVSRFRLSAPSHVPKTAEPAALALLGDINGKYKYPVFGAIDPLGKVSYPVVCKIVGQLSKIFLVSDLSAGIKTLLREDLRNTITGGELTECNFIPLTTGLGAPATKKPQ